MAWVVDTCILIDVLEDDQSFGRPSAQTFDGSFKEGLTICPVTYVELAPAFEGDLSLQDEFLMGVGIDFRQGPWEDTLRAHEAWNHFICRRRLGLALKRPIADVLIGAFASRHQGLITEKPERFCSNLFGSGHPSTPSRWGLGLCLPTAVMTAD